MHSLFHQLELLGTAALGIVLAVAGDMVRLWHEHERGKRRWEWQQLPFSLIRGLLMGVIAVSFAQWAHAAYNVPELAGGGLGGVLGYLGPTIIPYWFERLARKFFPQDEDKGSDGNDP